MQRAGKSCSLYTGRGQSPGWSCVRGPQGHPQGGISPGGRGAEGEAGTARPWLSSEIQCPLSSLLARFVWQRLEFCDSSEPSTGSPSSCTCEECRAPERGPKNTGKGCTPALGQRHLQGQALHPAGNTLEVWDFLPSGQVVADLDRFFSASIIFSSQKTALGKCA